MMKKLIVFVCGATLMACAPESKPKKDEGNGGTREVPVVVETDAGGCQNGPTPSSLEGSWKAQLRADRIRMNLKLTFQGARFVMSNTCTMNGVPAVTASATSFVKITSTDFTAQSDGDDVRESRGATERMTCSVGFKRGQIFTYRFRGSCVEITANGQTTTLVPVR